MGYCNVFHFYIDLESLVLISISNIWIVILRIDSVKHTVFCMVMLCLGFIEINISFSTIILNTWIDVEKLHYWYRYTFPVHIMKLVCPIASLTITKMKKTPRDGVNFTLQLQKHIYQGEYPLWRSFPHPLTLWRNPWNWYRLMQSSCRPSTFV